MEVMKAIIPAAGLGTRFLPFTKSIPKEMLPVLNKPAIQHVIEEGLKSEVTNFLIVTGKSKNVIADHFDYNPELDEQIFGEREKEFLISSIKKIIRNAHFTYIRQPEALGLGHAIWMTRHSIGKEYFSILLPDDIIIGKNPALAQLLQISRQEKASVVAVQEVPPECVSSYGVIAVKKQITPKLFQISHLIEKPQQKDSPSNLAVIGRYILSSKIFQSLEEITPYAVGELQLTNAISHMTKNGEKVFAYKVQGTRYDIGTPLGWLKATIGTALNDPNYSQQLREFLSDLDTPNSFVYNQEKIISNSL